MAITIGRDMRHKALASTALGTLILTSSVAINGSVNAQDAQQAESVEIEEIVVTGSRIRRSSLTTPVPITTVGAEDIELSGETNISEVISEVPGLAASFTGEQSVNNNEDDVDTASGVAVLNLRGLGSNRTLVLVNGRRHVGGRAGDTAVNINTIPTALVERIEVLTGGASAIYGADAVTGVVNFILQDDFEGIDARAQFGISDEGDAEEFYVSVTGGGNFDDGRGNAVLNVEYREQNILRQKDRAFSRNGGVANTCCDTSNPLLRIQESDLTPDLIAAGVTAGGSILGFEASNPGVLPASLVARAMSAASSAIGEQPAFAISSRFGRIVPEVNGDFGFGADQFGNPFSGDFPGETPFDTDVNNNGIPDLEETFLGRNGFGSLVFDDELGQVRLFNPGIFASFANQFGGDGTLSGRSPLDTLRPEQERLTINANLRYNITDSLTWFTEAKFVYENTFTTDQLGSFNDLLTIQLDNPFLPQELQDAAQAFLATPEGAPFTDTFRFLVTRDQSELGQGEDIDRHTLRVVSGFEGELGANWLYELSANYGRTTEKNNRFNERVEDRWFAAIDAVIDPETGQPACRSEVDPSAPPPPTSSFPSVEPGFRTFAPGDGSCKPFNIFGADVASQEAKDFVTADNIRNDTIEQLVINATMTGDTSGFLELPAGPIGVAFGGEYREEKSEAQQSNFEEAGLFFSSGATSLTGKFDVWEFFGEASIPLLRDKPFVEELTLDGAFRFADYSTVGSNTTWEVRGTWTPISDIRFRASFSRAIRAPNIAELFQPLTADFFDPTDPCDPSNIDSGSEFRRDNCLGGSAVSVPAGFSDSRTGRFQGVSGGNPELTEERADTLTIGAVITPSAIPNLAITIDYWDIELDDAIAFLDDQDIVNNCFDFEQFPDNQFCNAISRDPSTNNLNFLSRSQFNIAAAEATGVDFGASYLLDLEPIVGRNSGTLDLSVVGTWTDKLVEFPDQNDPTVRDPRLKEFQSPEWQANFNARWNWEDLTVNYQLRYLSSMAVAGAEIETIDDVSIINIETLEVRPAFTGNAFIHDLSLRYQLHENVGATFGVRNLAGRDPFIAAFSYPVSSVGRFFFLRLTANL